MRFPRNGRRRGGRWLTAVAARWLVDGSVRAWFRRAWGVAAPERGPGEAPGGAGTKSAPSALIVSVGAFHALDERRWVHLSA